MSSLQIPYLKKGMLAQIMCLLGLIRIKYKLGALQGTFNDHLGPSAISLKRINICC